MQTANDIRSDFPRLLRQERPRDRAVLPAGAAQRSDAACSPTPAWCSSRTSSPAQEKRDYKRAVTAQKCVRAGGKHNDLENVGYTARHHTFFEMLGNFSFGDYFKDVAIELAWNLVTKTYGLPKDRLLVTVFCRRRRGLRSLEEDRRPAGSRRSSASATSDNFWAMGDTGPCGPCSEIFFDHGPDDRRRPARQRRPGRRPLHRDLEPGLHAVRAGDEGRSASRCPRRRSTPAWGWSGSPPCCRASMTTTTST